MAGGPLAARCSPYRCFTARGLPGFRLTLAAVLFADPQLFVTFTQNCDGAVSGDEVKLSESVPTGLLSLNAGPWNQA
jgi:hypothetical protein